MNDFNLVRHLWYRKSKYKIRSLQGPLPLMFKSKSNSISHYRIYGNTVNQQSVGDLVTDGEHAGTYHIPVIMNGLNLLPPPAESRTVEQDGLIFSASTDGTYSVRSTSAQGAAQGSYINFALASPIVIPDALSSGGHGVIQCNNSRGPANSVAIRFFNGIGTRVGVLYANVANRIWDNYTFGGETITAIGIYVAAGTVVDVTFRPAVYLDTQEQIPFVNYQEPLGTNIFLQTPLQKVNDDADYIDYSTQKRYNCDGTTVDISLPALTALPGTNRLTVATAVPPSAMEIRGKIRGLPTEEIHSTRSADPGDSI